VLKKVIFFVLMLVSFSFAQVVSQQEKSEAKEVTVKKSFGKINMDMFCGVVRPYEVKTPDPIIVLMENKKGYTTKISYIKLTLTSGKRRLYIEAERGFANKDYSKLELRGLKKVENKGFSMPQKAHTVIVNIRNNNVFIDRVK